MPSLSVIVATFNSEKTINRTIKSIELLKVIFEKIEIIVIDNLSIDKTLSVVELNKKKNRCIDDWKVLSEKDAGIFDAYNKGVALARNDWILILNSDDYIKFVPDNLLIKSDVEAYCSNIVFEKFGDEKRYWSAKDKYSKANLMNKWDCPPHPGLFIKRSLFDKIGLFDDGFKVSGDYAWILKLRNNYPIVNSHIVVGFNMGGVSTQGIKSLYRTYKEDKIALKAYYGFMSPVFSILKKISKLKQFKK